MRAFWGSKIDNLSWADKRQHDSNIQRLSYLGLEVDAEIQVGNPELLTKAHDDELEPRLR